MSIIERATDRSVTELKLDRKYHNQLVKRTLWSNHMTLMNFNWNQIDLNWRTTLTLTLKVFKKFAELENEINVNLCLGEFSSWIFALNSNVLATIFQMSLKCETVQNWIPASRETGKLKSNRKIAEFRLQILSPQTNQMAGIFNNINISSKSMKMFFKQKREIFASARIRMFII